MRFCLALGALWIPPALASCISDRLLLCLPLSLLSRTAAARLAWLLLLLLYVAEVVVRLVVTEA